MNRFMVSSSNSSDAKNFAPSSCSAENTKFNTHFADIAIAVSFLLCIIINIHRISALIILLLASVINKTKRQPLKRFMCA